MSALETPLYLTTAAERRATLDQCCIVSCDGNMQRQIKDETQPVRIQTRPVINEEER